MAKRSRRPLEFATAGAGLFAHAEAIRDANNARPDGSVVIGAGLVALLSIRMQWRTVPAMFAAVMSGKPTNYLFGAKRAGYAFLIANRRRLWEATQAYHANPDKARAREALQLEFLAVPNLGIVKASFVCQMLVGAGACLDMHNLDRMGLDRNAFNTPKGLTADTVLIKLRTYNAACDAQGTSAQWWQGWCAYYAAINPDLFFRAHDVSAAHLVALEWSDAKANAPAKTAHNGRRKARE